jgi:hypothetical protein
MSLKQCNLLPPPPSHHQIPCTPSPNKCIIIINNNSNSNNVDGDKIPMSLTTWTWHNPFTSYCVYFAFFIHMLVYPKHHSFVFFSHCCCAGCIAKVGCLSLDYGEKVDVVTTVPVSLHGTYLFHSLIAFFSRLFCSSI